LLKDLKFKLRKDFLLIFMMHKIAQDPYRSPQVLLALSDSFSYIPIFKTLNSVP
jgi:hypothetical protein